MDYSHRVVAAILTYLTSPGCYNLLPVAPSGQNISAGLTPQEVPESSQGGWELTTREGQVQQQREWEDPPGSRGKVSSQDSPGGQSGGRGGAGGFFPKVIEVCGLSKTNAHQGRKGGSRAKNGRKQRQGRKKKGMKESRERRKKKDGRRKEGKKKRKGRKERLREKREKREENMGERRRCEGKGRKEGRNFFGLPEKFWAPLCS
ncbi:Chromatin assembly factor 1 subunit A, partial [Ophiophagus hannah]